MSDHPDSDWHLRDWAAELGKKQADLVKELGWPKNQAHRLWHSVQPYRRDYLNAAAAWLGIEPFELLMHPKEAMRIRRLRALLAEEAGRNPNGDSHEPSGGRRRTGTHG